MVKISIFYPNKKESRFDMNYYINIHMPMSIKLLSANKGFRGVTVDRGVGGEAPDSDPEYTAMCHFLFDSIEEFLAAFSPHAKILQGDMLNYTDIKPVIQISAIEIIV
jgi:uncharacterized protein (TIGR02118 family)